MKTIIVLSAVILFLAGSAYAQDISVQQLHEKLEAGEKLFLIDVREPFEHAQSDPLGGILIPLARIGNLNDPLPELDARQDGPIVLYDRSANRTNLAWEFMINRGIADVRKLTGGLIAWIEVYGDQRFTPDPKPKAPHEPAEPEPEEPEDPES